MFVASTERQYTKVNQLVYELNVALVITTYFSRTCLTHLSADLAVLKTQNTISYNAFYTEMFNSVSQVCHVTLDISLSGDSSLSIDTNSRIVLSVHKFIKDSKRF